MAEPPSQNREPRFAPAPRQPGRDLFVWLALLGVIAMNLVAIGIGGWHFYRYVLAPELGMVSTEDAWSEHLRVATSAFRLLEEKDVALDRLLELPDEAKALSEAERQAAVDALDNVVYMEDYPLDLKFKASRVQTMIRGGGVTAPTRREERRARVAARRAERAAAVTAAAVRMEELIALEGEALRESSPERTELLVTLFREQPCDPRLLQWLEALRDRPGLPGVERSFVYGMYGQREMRCSSSTTE